MILDSALQMFRDCESRDLATRNRARYVLKTCAWLYELPCSSCHLPIQERARTFIGLLPNRTFRMHLNCLRFGAFTYGLLASERDDLKQLMDGARR